MKLAKILKIGALLICFSMLLGMLAACGDTEDPPATPANTTPGDTTPSDGGTADPTPTPTGNNIPALPADFVGIDFMDGKADFLTMHFRPMDSSPDATLEVVDFRGTKAAKVTPDGTAVPYVAIDVCSLLGDRITDLYAVEIMMAVQSPDGKFHSVAGELLAYSGQSRKESKFPWSVFIETRNPNAIRAELKDDDQKFVPDAHNMFIIRRTDDNSIETARASVRAVENTGRVLEAEAKKLQERIDEGPEAGEDDFDEAAMSAEIEKLSADAAEKLEEARSREGEIAAAASALFITSIAFFDEAGNYIPVNSGAVFNEPPNFNTAATEIIELPIMNIRNSDFHQGWLTDGVDNVESPYTYEQFARAQQLVLEFTNAPTGPMQIVWQGNGDNWSWHQTNEIVPEEGMEELTLTINLFDVLINFDKFQESTQMKLIIGYENVDDLGITRAYLVALADNKYELPVMNLRNSDFHQGWLTDGVDNVESPYLYEDFSRAMQLVLEFTNPPTGSMQIVWQGDGDGWSWNQTNDIVGEDGMEELTLTINLFEVLVNFDAFKASTQLKLIIGYENVDDLGITRAYLVLD